VIVFSERVTRETSGLEGLALAVAAAAVLTLPVSVAAIDGLDVSRIPTVAAVGVLGIAIPYALFLQAIRHVGAKTYSILLSLDPAVAVLAGLLVLGQSPDVGAVFGIGLVVAASAVAVGTRSPR
jgi:inner membrane transporter RhtA